MRFRWTAVVSSGVAGLLCCAGAYLSDLQGQDPRRVTVSAATLESLGAGLATFSPHSGPPGTTVHLQVRDMPALAPLRIGVGALHVGFEEAGWILSNDEGELTIDVVIPPWGRSDVVHLFIVFDPYFNPIALTDVFHVTTPDGLVQRTGRVANDAGCFTLRGTDGVTYGLRGDVSQVAVGTRLEVEGRIVEEPFCNATTVIDVTGTRTLLP